VDLDDAAALSDPARAAVGLVVRALAGARRAPGM
jgi:hypothetical protein